MFFKLALRNVKRSYQDYTIYFMTLILAVSVFYIFNSLASLDFLTNVFFGANWESLEILETLIIYLSVFISVILGFLIIYANSFLIRRRKKELGIYLTLGMERRGISGILLLETFFIGILSLIVGIGLGIPLSQVLGILVMRVMGVNLVEINFVFSWAVVERTILYFGVMFLAVMILNVFSVSRYKIISLIHAQKQHQKLGFASGVVSFLIFILALGSLGWTYKNVLSPGAFQTIIVGGNIVPVLVAGMVGTFLLFLSLAGFLMVMIKGQRRFYYQDLNLFTLRQFSSRIQTNWLSLALITLMLTISISSVSMGRSLNDFLSYYDEFTPSDTVPTPFDVTIRTFSDHTMDEVLDAYELDLNQFTDEAFPLTTYVTELLMGDFFEAGTDSFEEVANFQIDTHQLSEVNPILRAQGYDSVELKDNEILMILYSNIFTEDRLKTNSIVFNGQEYTIAYILNTPLSTSNSTGSIGIVFPDSVNLATEATTSKVVTALSFDYRGDTFTQERAFMTHISQVRADSETDLSDFIVLVDSKNEIINHVNIVSITLTFITFYLAAIFILVSVTILALQQLIDAVESAERYEVLKKMGVSESMISKSLRIQIGGYFLVPLVVASIHSAVAVLFVNRILVEETTRGTSNPLLNITTFAIIWGVSFLYYMATYVQSKRVFYGGESV